MHALCGVETLSSQSSPIGSRRLIGRVRSTSRFLRCYNDKAEEQVLRSVVRMDSMNHLISAISDLLK